MSFINLELFPCTYAWEKVHPFREACPLYSTPQLPLPFAIEQIEFPSHYFELAHNTTCKHIQQQQQQSVKFVYINTQHKWPFALKVSMNNSSLLLDFSLFVGPLNILQCQRNTRKRIRLEYWTWKRTFKFMRSAHKYSAHLIYILESFRERFSSIYWVWFVCIMQLDSAI